jgi:hypothetical protein
MKIISHRGNLNGPNSFTENSISAITIALNKGFDVEIDVWFQNNKLYLGHDKPQYEIKESFLENKKLWCHAKNFEALNLMLKNKKIHCFWHENDLITLTNLNYKWCFPNKNLDKKCVVIDNSINWIEKKYKCYGICTDYPLIK